jgi:EAL domain-containing protein (putative c-di-GMP-specific phosphodiesterase class I)
MQSMRSARTDQPQAVVPQRELLAAIHADELRLEYQPIVVLASARIRGVEALLRWHLPDGTRLLPDDFLPAIAHTPVMHELTAWVIDRACAQASEWAPWTMSVNIAAVDVVRPSLVDVVAEALHRHKLPPERLVVELTEHAAVQGLGAATDVLQRLRALGVGVALDDFGTGYSSLLYLRDLPVTEVKIDRTFVSGVERQEDDAAIVQSVVQLAGAVGMAVVAEGVETAGQARFLHHVGCKCAQGYRYARPAPPPDVPHELSPDLFVPYPEPRGRARGLRLSRQHRVEAPGPEVLGRIVALVEEGASLHTIAAALNREGLVTGAGTRWTAPAVARALRNSAAADV